MPFTLAAPDTLVGLPRTDVRLVSDGEQPAALVTYGKGLGGIAVIERSADHGRRGPTTRSRACRRSRSTARPGTSCPPRSARSITVAARRRAATRCSARCRPTRPRPRCARCSRERASVEARGLVKTYGEITAVDHVDLTVEPGDVYGFLGPNGAGKTTSLRMLLGLIRPTAGAARLFGRDPMVDGVRALDGVAGLRRGAALLPVPPGARTSSCSRRSTAATRAAQIDAVLDTVDLADRAKDRVGGYSHGMRQRLGIAGALLRARGCCCSTSPRPASTRRACATCARSIRRLADERHHGAALEPPADRGRGALQPRRDHPRGPHRLRGRARRPARHGRRQLHAAHVRRRRAAAQICAAQPGVASASRRPRRPAHARRRGAIEALTVELAQPGVAMRALVPDAASLEERFFALTEDAAPGEPPAPVPRARARSA